MAEQPHLEHIIEDFINDTAMKINYSGPWLGDGYHAHGRRGLFHNMYTRIDDDQRCVQFANEMSLWAQEYTKEVSFMASWGKKSGKAKYLAPAAFITVSSCMGVGTGVFIATGGPSLVGLVGFMMSGFLLMGGVRAFYRLKQGVQDQRIAFGFKPYEAYAEDIKEAPVEAVREALLAKKEYARATLGLTLSDPASIPQS